MDTFLNSQTKQVQPLFFEIEMSTGSQNNNINNNAQTALESLKLHDAYKKLSFDMVLKTSIGGLIGGLLLYRFPGPRRNLACLGAGIGLGYSIKEVDLYLKNPTQERLPNAWEQMKDPKNRLSSMYHNAANKIFPKKGQS